MSFETAITYNQSIIKKDPIKRSRHQDFAFTLPIAPQNLAPTETKDANEKTVMYRPAKARMSDMNTPFIPTFGSGLPVDTCKKRVRFAEGV
jgi:hypothetical protein